MAKQLLVDFMVLRSEEDKGERAFSLPCRPWERADAIWCHADRDCLHCRLLVTERKGRIGIISIILVKSKYEIPVEYQVEKTRSGWMYKLESWGLDVA